MQPLCRPWSKIGLPYRRFCHSCQRIWGEFPWLIWFASPIFTRIGAFKLHKLCWCWCIWQLLRILRQQGLQWWWTSSRRRWSAGLGRLWCLSNLAGSWGKPLIQLIKVEHGRSTGPWARTSYQLLPTLWTPQKVLRQRQSLGVLTPTLSHICIFLPGRDQLTIEALSLISMINYIILYIYIYAVWYDMIERERVASSPANSFQMAPAEVAHLGGWRKLARNATPAIPRCITESPFSMQLVVIVLAEHMRVFV